MGRLKAAAGRAAGRAALGWLFGGLGASAAVVIGIFAITVAVVGASLTGCQTTGPQTTGGQAGPTPSAYARQNIPPVRLAIYQQAGARFDIDWSFLASIGTQECASATCAGTNSSGCAGPMQIAYQPNSLCSPGNGPTLWERYGVSAHPGQPPEVNDLADAIFTAARILREDKGAPPTGGSYSAYYRAACNYFGACAETNVAYAQEVMARAVQYGFAGTGSPPPTSPPLAEPVPTEPLCNSSILTPGAASRSRIVRVAESQLGKGGQPPGSDCTIYGRCEEWCSLFLAWVWQHAGVPLPGNTNLYGYSGSLYTWVKEHTHQVLPPTARPSPGYAVFFGEGPQNSVHVALVQRVYSDGRITTINGNDVHDKVGTAGPFLPSQETVHGQHIYGYAQPPTAETNAPSKPTAQGARR